MKEDSLLLETYIAESHDDNPVVESIIVGFDDDKRLLLKLVHTNYDYPECNTRTIAVLVFNEAVRLASRLKCRTAQLPEKLWDLFGVEVDTYTTSQVKDVFKDMLDYICSLGVKFTVN